MLHAYFDTGNAIDPREYDIVTLAGYSARDKDWVRLQQRWKAAVTRAWAECDMPNPDIVTPFLHTTDLISRNKLFTMARGWNKDKESRLLSECVDIIVDECSTGLVRGVSSSLLLEDYAKVRRENRKKIASVEDICSTFCVGHALAWSPEFADSYLTDGGSLFFDQGEKFRGSIVNLKRHKSNRNSLAFQKLIHIGEVDMKVVPAVQAADLLAWSINAKHENNLMGDWQTRLLELPRESQFLTEEVLRKPNLKHLESLLALNLPNRRFPEIVP